MGANASRVCRARHVTTATETEDETSRLHPETDTFPNPANVECLLFTPPKGMRHWRVEETFWDDKLALIPDNDFMRLLDERAKKVSGGSNTEVLVRQLTEGLENDLGKVGVLVKWISHHISYDVRALESGNHPDKSVNIVMGRKKAVCDGYSELFAHFCSIAGISCDVISGLSREYPGYTFDPDNPRKSKCAHAWNKVQINGRWYLCDVTLAAGVRATENGREVFKRRWREQWFLAEPIYFLSTHLPMDSEGVLTNEQLVEKPISKLNQWNKTPLTWPITGTCSIKSASHHSGVIRSRTPTVTVLLHTPNAYALEYSSSLADLPMPPSGTAGENKILLQEHKNRVLIHTMKNKVCAMVRLPERGSYRLDITINAPGLCHTEADPRGRPVTAMADVFRYEIVYEGKKQTDPFPDGSSWGLLPKYRCAGFDLLSTNSAVVPAKRGKCSIRIKLPSSGIVPNLFKLKCKEYKADEKYLNSYVYGEKKGDLAIYHIQCPEKGEYRFELYFKDEGTEPEGAGFRLGAAFLIKCKTSNDRVSPYLQDYASLCGPTKDFYRKYELATDASGSTLPCKNGRTQLLIKKTRQDVQITAYISYMSPEVDNRTDYNYLKKEDRVDTSQADGFVRMNVRSINKRRSFLNVYANGYLVAVYYLKP